MEPGCGSEGTFAATLRSSEILHFFDLTKKKLFLVSLASAKWVKELQALSHKFIRQGDDILLSYLPEFAAKTKKT